MNKNIKIDEFLEVWVKLSYMFFKEQKATKEELDRFHQVNKYLENNGINKVEIINIKTNVCVLRYLRNGKEFKKKVNLQLN